MCKCTRMLAHLFVCVGVTVKPLQVFSFCFVLHIILLLVFLAWLPLFCFLSFLFFSFFLSVSLSLSLPISLALSAGGVADLTDGCLYWKHLMDFVHWFELVNKTIWPWLYYMYVLCFQQSSDPKKPKDWVKEECSLNKTKITSSKNISAWVTWDFYWHWQFLTMWNLRYLKV